MILFPPMHCFQSTHTYRCALYPLLGIYLHVLPIFSVNNGHQVQMYFAVSLKVSLVFENILALLTEFMPSD